MKLYESYKRSRELKNKKYQEEVLLNIYEQLERELEYILYDSLIKRGKDSVIVGVKGVEPSYFIDILVKFNSDVYQFEQLSLDKYKFILKKIV